MLRKISLLYFTNSIKQQLHLIMVPKVMLDYFPTVSVKLDFLNIMPFWFAVEDYKNTTGEEDEL